MFCVIIVYATFLQYSLGTRKWIKCFLVITITWSIRPWQVRKTDYNTKATMGKRAKGGFKWG